MKLHSTKLNSIVLVAALVGLAGCSQAPALRGAPVAVSGKVLQGAQPVGNVMLSLQPLDVGHACSFPVKPDGTFSGEVISGNYAYFVGKLPAPNSEAALKKVDPKYLEADLGRSVAVEDGKELIIALN